MFDSHLRVISINLRFIIFLATATDPFATDTTTTANTTTTDSTTGKRKKYVLIDH